MMGQQERTESLFYYFRLEDQIPEDHLLRLIEPDKRHAPWPVRLPMSIPDERAIGLRLCLRNSSSACASGAYGCVDCGT